MSKPLFDDIVYYRTSYIRIYSLKRRLNNDFGFEVALKYEDRDGDFITMSSQEDLQDLLAYSHSDIINVLVSESTSLPQLNVRNVATAQQRTVSVGSRSGSDWPRPNNVGTPTHNTAVMSLPRLGQQPQRSVDRFPNIFQDPDAPIRWKRAEILGQGAFGVVYLGLNIDTGELMAVKQMATEEVSRRELSSLENEINLLRNLRHPNIVRYIGTELTSTSMSIFLEYVPGGSLKALIDKFGLLEEAVARSYTRQLLLGLEYLHRNGIAHRDVKGANCLVGNDGVIKLADFGNSKHWRPVGAANVSLGATQSGDIKGTPAWMAPEVVRDQGGIISWRKADIWSLACTTLEMTTGRSPWSQFNNSVTILYHLACQETLPEYPASPSTELLTFLNVCFQRDPQLRPDTTSLLLHPFVLQTNTNGGGWLQRPTTMSSLAQLSHSESNGAMALFPMPRRPTAHPVHHPHQPPIAISAEQALATQQALAQQQQPQSARVVPTRSEDNTVILARDRVPNTARPAPAINESSSAFTPVGSNPNSGHNSLNNSINMTNNNIVGNSASGVTALTGSAAFVYYDQDPENTHELPAPIPQQFQQQSSLLLPTSSATFDEEIVGYHTPTLMPLHHDTHPNTPNIVVDISISGKAMNNNISSISPTAVSIPATRQSTNQSLSTKASRKSSNVSGTSASVNKKAQAKPGRNSNNSSYNSAVTASNATMAVAAPAPAAGTKNTRGAKAVPILEMKSLGIVNNNTNNTANASVNLSPTKKNGVMLQGNRSSPTIPVANSLLVSDAKTSSRHRRSPHMNSKGLNASAAVYDSDDASSCHTPWQHAYNIAETEENNEAGETESVLYADDELGSIDGGSLGTLETTTIGENNTTENNTARDLQSQISLPSIHEHSSFINTSISPQQQLLSARVTLHPIDPASLSSSGNNTARTVTVVQAVKNLPSLNAGQNKRHNRRNSSNNRSVATSLEQGSSQQMPILQPSEEPPLKLDTQQITNSHPPYQQQATQNNEDNLFLESIDKPPLRSMSLLSPVPPPESTNNITTTGGGALSPGQPRMHKRVLTNVSTPLTSSRIATGARRSLHSAQQPPPQSKAMKKEMSTGDLLDMSCDSLESLHITGTTTTVYTRQPSANTNSNNNNHMVNNAPIFRVDEPPSAANQMDNIGKGSVDMVTPPTISLTEQIVSSEPILIEDHTAAVTRLRTTTRYPNLLFSSSLDGTIRIWSNDNTTSGTSLDSNLDHSRGGSYCKAVLSAELFAQTGVGTTVGPSNDMRRISLGPRQPSSSDLHSLNNDNNSITNASFDNYDNSSVSAANSNKAMRISDFWVEDSCDTIWAVCSDAAVRVWSLGTNGMEYLSHRPLRLLKGHEDAITCLTGLDATASNSSGSSISSSASLVATGSADRTIRLWDHRARKQQVFLFRGHGDTVLSMAWMEEGRALVSSSKDRMIKVWDTRAGRIRCTMERHFGSVHTVRTTSLLSSNTVDASTTSVKASSSSGEVPAIVSAGRDAMINFWSSSGDLLTSQTAAHRGHTSYLSMAYATSSRSLLMVSAGADGLLKIWDARRPRSGCQAELLAPSGGVAKMAWAFPSHQSQMQQQAFVVVGSTGAVRLYEKEFSYNNGSSTANDATLTNNHSSAASAAAAGNDWKLTELKGHNSGCTDVVCGENMIAVAAKNGRILRWNVFMN